MITITLILAAIISGMTGELHRNRRNRLSCYLKRQYSLIQREKIVFGYKSSFCESGYPYAGFEISY